MQRSWMALLVVALLGIAACETDEPVEEPVEEVDEPVDEAEEPTEATVAVAETDLGPALTDAAGMSLYLFETDEQGESTCYDECADSWPPLTVDDDPVAGDDVDEALLGTVTRDDGSEQVTYDDWPLYTFAGDNEPGDVNGQGIQDVWWLVAPDGAPIQDDADASADAGADAGADDDSDRY